MKSLLLIILAYIYSLPVLAQSKSEGAGYASQWGASNLKISGAAGKTFNVACLGTSEDAGLTQISNNGSWGDMRRDLRNYYLDYNALYYVAREINKNGAKFCKTIVTGKRGGCTGNAHTTYFEPTGGADCFWLCKYGYFGDGCSARVAYATSPKLTTQQFGAKKPKSGVVAMAANKKENNTNIEDKIPMFQYGKYVKCHSSVTVGDETKGKVDLKNWASTNTQEHDIVLALKTVAETSTTITGTTVPALKMQVQPLVVRAGTTQMCAEKGNDRAMAMVEFAGDAIDVCPSDYDNYCASTNSGNCTNLLCVDPTAKSKVEQEKKQQQTEDKLKNMCADYTRDSYKPGVHELYYVSKTSLEEIEPQPDDTINWGDVCVKYKCTASKAFKADWQTSGDMGCYECTGDAARFGIDNQGVCQQCVKGEIFDSDTKKCVKARVFSKNDMRFGVGNAPSADFGDQCWTKDNPDCYKCCMMGESGASEECKRCEELTETESDE